MTGIVFVVGLIWAYIYWLAEGYFIAGHVTVYVLLFVLTLSCAVMWAVISENRRCITAAGVLMLSFVGDHYAWNSANPILYCAIFDTLTAAWFILTGTTRMELWLGSIFLASVAVVGLTQLGVIPDSQHRPDAFLAFSHPDLTAILGHLANVVLGLGAGDGGKLRRLYLESRPVVFDLRRSAISGVAALAKSAGSPAKD